MTLLELYEKLCTGEIKLEGFFNKTAGLCLAINHNIGMRLYLDFNAIFGFKGKYLPNRGVMTHERETFLLLFAAYKGEL